MKYHHSQRWEKIANTNSNLNISKSTGHRDVISVPVTTLVKRSFLDVFFPNALKVAEVTPIFKDESRAAYSNKRPIFPLHNIEKIIEKLIHKRLYSVLESQSFFKPALFNCQLNVWISAVLMWSTEKIQTQMTQRQYSAEEFVDQKKTLIGSITIYYRENSTTTALKTQSTKSSTHRKSYGYHQRNSGRTPPNISSRHTPLPHQHKWPPQKY